MKGEAQGPYNPSTCSLCELEQKVVIVLGARVVVGSGLINYQSCHLRTETVVVSSPRIYFSSGNYHCFPFMEKYGLKI